MLNKLVKTAGVKIKRDAFLYFEPRGVRHGFAQCETCNFWTASGNCALMGGKKVPHEASCGAYIQRGIRSKTAVATYTPEELGYVERPVRCENCKFGGKTCKLYEVLNKTLPDVFDLGAKIKPQGCCNAQEPK